MHKDKKLIYIIQSQAPQRSIPTILLFFELPLRRFTNTIQTITKKFIPYFYHYKWVFSYSTIDSVVFFLYSYVYPSITSFLRSFFSSLFSSLFSSFFFSFFSSFFSFFFSSFFSSLFSSLFFIIGSTFILYYFAPAKSEFLSIVYFFYSEFYSSF